MAPSLKAKAPSIIVVMGVSGSGKSTIAAMLATRLGWIYEDADLFHPPANVAKMQAGKPLTDEDRWPWLRAIANWIDNMLASGQHATLACSALRRAYRDILIGDRTGVGLVYLKGEQALIAGRMALRHGHFMPTSLLESQFATLQDPGMDEHPIVIGIDARPQVIVDSIVAQLNLSRTSGGDPRRTQGGTAAPSSSGSGS